MSSTPLRRLTRHFLLAGALVAATVLTGFPAQIGSVNAAAGDVTSSTFTPPSAVSSATLRLSITDGAGGSYQAYSQGQTVSLIRVLPSGASDSAFNSGTPVSIALPTALQSSGNFVVRGTNNPASNSWWLLTASQTYTNNSIMGLTLTVGTRAGATTFTKNITGSSIVAKCAGLVSGATEFQSPTLYPRRDGGAWLAVMCATSVDVTAATVLIPLTATGDFDSSAQAVSASATNGSSHTCFISSTTVADPTSKAPAPELWIIRIEHNYQESGRCRTNTSGSTNGTPHTSLIASSFGALGALAVAADGTVTRTALPGTNPLQPTGSRIDPGGRMVFLASELTDSTKVYMSRLKADGSLDTSIGTSGYLPLNTGALPSGAIGVRASLVGVVTTADRVYFAVLLTDNEVNSYTNSSTTLRTHGFRMGLVSPASGWVSSFGTNGIGTRVTTALPENWFSQGKTTSTGSSVNSEGQPVVFTFGETETKYNVWSAISGVTGGGEGGTGLGGATTDTGGAPSAGSADSSSQTATTTTTTTTTIAATTTTVAKNPYDDAVAGVTVVDSKVYTKLPTPVAKASAVNVLTDAQSRAFSVISVTTRTCLASGKTLVFIAKGRCRANIIASATGAVTRRLTTTVTDALINSVKVGNPVAVLEPIYFYKESVVLDRAAQSRIRSIKSRVSAAGTVLIIGHSGTLNGNTAINVEISKGRAASTLRALESVGAKGPFVASGVGALQPANKGKTEAAQVKNRRVVIALIP